jgi:hypothetical protein
VELYLQNKDKNINNIPKHNTDETPQGGDTGGEKGNKIDNNNKDNNNKDNNSQGNNNQDNNKTQEQNKDGGNN